VSNKINKVVIVGGGSAGWMSASTLISQFPEKEIVVIESPNVPIIGVGESTIGGINDWVNLVGIDRNDFMHHTDASYKLSIRFTDFYKKGSGSFHYPFGYPDTSGNIAQKNDWYFKKFLIPETQIDDYANCMYPNMSLVNQNKIFKNEDGRLPNFNFYRDTAFHFDATKFSIWLRDKFCKPKGVKHIQAEVKDVITNEDGVEYLLLDSGEKITADLFIDCTGFKSILLAGALKEPFNSSYQEMLPNNSAWATRISYTDKEKQLVSYTDCHAIENGWVWNIPLWSRIGTGYVYSDKYISDEDALEEFKDHLKFKGNSVDDLEFKNIKMRVGIHDRIWVKNVAAIGLSAGFIEPLESSGLYTVHEFLFKLVRTLGRDKDGYVNQFDKDAYNFTCQSQFKGFAQFVALHYALSHRDDTEYWRSVGKRVYSKEVEYPNYRPGVDNFIDAIVQKFNDYQYSHTFSGLHCILTGLNCFPIDKYSLKSFDYSGTQSMSWEPAMINLETKKYRWNESVKDCPSLMQYLQEHHYK
jgi:hypothetical protein